MNANENGEITSKYILSKKEKKAPMNAKMPRITDIPQDFLANDKMPQITNRINEVEI